MQTHLSRNQRRGTAIFLGLCLLCLAAAIWKNSFLPDPASDPHAEAELLRQLNALQPIADTIQQELAPSQPVRSGRKKRSKSHPGNTPAPRLPARSPLDEPVSAK